MGLLDVIKKIPSAKEMKGGFGEYLTKYYSKLVLDGLVIHDVLIDGEDEDGEYFKLMKRI